MVFNKRHILAAVSVTEMYWKIWV